MNTSHPHGKNHHQPGQYFSHQKPLVMCWPGPRWIHNYKRGQNIHPTGLRQPFAQGNLRKQWQIGFLTVSAAVIFFRTLCMASHGSGGRRKPSWSLAALRVTAFCRTGIYTTFYTLCPNSLLCCNYLLIVGLHLNINKLHLTIFIYCRILHLCWFNPWHGTGLNSLIHPLHPPPIVRLKREASIYETVSLETYFPPTSLLQHCLWAQ